MILPILTHPNKNLRRRALPVEQSRFNGNVLREIAKNMEDTLMAQKNGIGIAATQVGILDRIILVDMSSEGIVTFVNPEIIDRSKTFFEYEEGCFSVPDTYGIVNRHKSVTVKAQTLDGKTRIMKVKKLYAVVFQHEIDHLDGILFIDKIIRRTHGENGAI